MRATLNAALVLFAVVAVCDTAHGKKTADATYQRTSEWSSLPSRDIAPDEEQGLNASAAATTLVLASYKFDSGATCTAQGWTTVDLTQQTGTYWHVDDFAPSNSLGTIPPGTSMSGLSFSPAQGAKSMWMGKRIPPAGPVDFTHCGYLALPGYGNGWNQAFCSKDCLSVAGGATANLDIAFKLKYDTEPSYDATSLEYTTDCAGNVGWTEIDGGNPTWSGGDSISVAGPYFVGAGPVKVRIHFVADTAWSNQDGLYDGLGVIVDSLSWETKPVEDFEGEAVGANSSDDWQSCNTPGFGNYLALFKKAQANYEDQCTDNLSCYWAAINGSTEFYTCGIPPQPAQRVVPHMNVRGEYISNEIWSPVIPLSGTGSDFHLRYTVYRDLPIDNTIFHVWHVRTIGASGCPGVWRDRNFVHFGDSKDWAVIDQVIGSKVDVATGVAIQVALGVIDMCPFWCGVFGTGACHSPAPYFDNVKVLRVGIDGPQWDVRAIDTFQDTFSTNGTITGTARVDMAMDIRTGWANNAIAPGDSAIVLFLVDPNYIVGTGTNANGLLNDPNLSTFAGRHKTKKQAYLYVTVWPQGQPGKSGAPLSEGPGGQANRYPFSGTQVIDGITWTKVRMDFTYTGTANNPGIGDGTDPFVQNRFNVDINDNLFTPGDTIYYFYSATSAGGTTYYSTEYGPTTDISAVAANAMEVTILPAGGFNRGGDILYVDGADGTGVDTYYRGAFMVLGLDYLVDRYDVRGPSSAVSNRPSSRVTDIAVQLNGCYERILWDCGSLPITLGDGSGDPEKTDDYGMLNSFLSNLTSPGGVYLMGDDVPEALSGYAGASAVTFRSTYMPFTLINDNHRLSPTLFPISPSIKSWPGRAFTDNFFVFGGCPELNDFDVVGASGTSLVQMSYSTASSPNGAVVGNSNGNARVLLSGFSLGFVRDDELDGVLDRGKHLYDALWFLGREVIIIGAGDNPARSSLAQNYPNPFNPQTTIAFSLATKGHVSLRVYNVSGQLVRALANETRDSGAHTVTWDGRDQAGVQVSSGVYFCKLEAGSFAQTKKMVLLK